MERASYILVCAALLLAISLSVVVFSVFFFKQKVHGVRRDLKVLNGIITMEKKKVSLLETKIASEHSPTRIKIMADKYLANGFTNVRQLMTFDEISTYNNQHIVATTAR